MTESSPSDFQKLMASVGRLMLHWGFLEAALEDTVQRLRNDNGETNSIGTRGTFGDRLKEWRDLLGHGRPPGPPEVVAGLAEEIALLRRIRNLVAHDLAGATARPEDGEPHIWCVKRGVGPVAKGRRISLSELTTTIEAVDSCRHRLERLATEYKTAT